MTEEVVGFTQAQRRWILQRDGHRCQHFTRKNGKWRQCNNRSNLQVHHIIPRGWSRENLPKHFPVNGANNGITLCEYHHVGRYGVHPDTHDAKRAYKSGNKAAYKEMMDERKRLNRKGIPYWTTTYDAMYSRRAKKLTARFYQRGAGKYPRNRKRGFNGRTRKKRK